MGLATLFDRLLGRPSADASKTAAKDRLRLVLMHDRSDIPATMMEAIRAEMIHALSKYVEIDTEAMEVQLDRDQGAIGLSLNIPIRRVKTEAEAADALAAMHAVQAGKAIPETKEPPKPAPVEAEEEGEPSVRARDTGDLLEPNGTGDLDLAAERAEPND